MLGLALRIGLGKDSGKVSQFLFVAAHLVGSIHDCRPYCDTVILAMLQVPSVIGECLLQYCV